VKSIHLNEMTIFCSKIWVVTKNAQLENFSFQSSVMFFKEEQSSGENDYYHV